MAVIRPSALPSRSSPVATEVVPVDNGSTVAGATIAEIVNAGRPLASQTEAEAGTNATNAMTPYRAPVVVTAPVSSPAASAVPPPPASGEVLG